MVSGSLFCPHCGAAYSPGEKQCAFCQHVFADKPDPMEKSDLFHERYQMLNQIGTGGFGAVYRARDTQEQQRLVAIKQINLQGLTSQEIIEATDGFNRERQFLSSLTHDHLPRIYDHFMDTEHWYLIMEFIEGQTLEEYLQSLSSTGTSSVRTLSVDAMVDIGLQLCDVLGYLHGQPQPIIFRDLKPSNVMRTDRGAIYLIDFGIARYFKPGKLKDTIPFGSPGYAAPEQYGKGQTSAQADIYSLGALLYHMLSGLDPADNPFHFAPLRLYGTAGLAELETLIMQMVALDAQQRPSDIEAVTTELQHIKRLRDGAEQRIWYPPTAQNPISSVQTAGASPYWPGSPSQSGQQQAQMSQPQAQPQQGIGRRTLIKRGWQIGLVVGVGAVLLHYAVPLIPQTNTGPLFISPPKVYGPNLQLVLNVAPADQSSLITNVLYAPGRQLFAVADQAGNIFVLSTTTSHVIYQMSVSQPVTSLSWTLDAKYLSIAAGRSVYIWEIPAVVDDRKLGEITKDPWAVYHDIMPATVQTISWSPVYPLILAVCDINSNVRVFPISSKGERGRVLCESAGKPMENPLPGVRVMCWSTEQLYFWPAHDSINIWNLGNPSNEISTNKFQALDASIQDVLVLKVAGYIAILTDYGRVILFDPAFRVIRDLTIAGKEINAIVSSADELYIFGIASDGIYIWSVLSPADEPLFVASPQNAMLAIDYAENSDGKFLLLGGVDGVIQIWRDIS